MSADSKTFLKLAWTLAAIGCFIFPVILIPYDGSPQQWIRQVTADMFFGLTVLSFPAGLLCYFLLASVFYLFSPFDWPVSFYVLLWFGCFVAGYLQWFHFVPSRFKRERLTTLGLDETAATGKARRPHRSRRRRKAAPAQLDEEQVLSFEAARRTPLERVISES